MNYQESRILFQNGDVVFFSKGEKNIVRRLITWFSKGEFYHVGIAFWANVDSINPRLMLAEAQPDGFRIINLSAYQDRDMTVVRTEAQWSEIAAMTIDSAGTVSYDFIDLLSIGLHERFGIPIFRSVGAGSVCSAIVASILASCGIKDIQIMVSPQILFEQLFKKYGTFLSVKVSHP